MPVNPFSAGNGIGSRGNERNIASEARAIRSYDAARKKLLATLGGEQEALAGISAAHAATMKSRMRDHATHSRELLKTSSLLDAQGDTLKSLNILRERFHKEEMNRSDSLLQKYESIKQNLKEIQQDYKDSTTVIGYLFTPIAEGIDNLSKFGTIGKASRPIRDVSFSLRTFGSDTVGAANSVVNLGVALADTVNQVRAYESRVDALNETSAKLDLRFGTASGHSKKLMSDFINLSRTDINMEGSVKSVEAVTHSLMMMEAQGVDSASALNLITSRSKSAGISWEQSAESVEVLLVQADGLTAALQNTEGALGTLTVGVRDDFVRAIADATRNLDSNILSVENVGAAYAYAALKVSAFGLANDSVNKVAANFVETQTKSREDAFSAIGGARTAQQIREAIADIERESDTQFTSNPTTDRERAANEQIRRQAFQRIGIEETAENSNTLQIAAERSFENNALADQTVRNLLAGTRTQTTNDAIAMRETVGIQNLDPEVQIRMLKAHNYIPQNFDAEEAEGARRLLMEGSIEEAAAEMERIASVSAAAAETQAAPMEQALSAIATMKDPIQSLLNMKEYLKSIMLNVSNIVSFMSHMGGMFNSLGGLVNSDTSASIIAAENAAERTEALTQSQQQQQQLVLRLTESLAAAAGDPARTAAITQSLAAAAAFQQKTTEALSRTQATQQQSVDTAPTLEEAVAAVAPPPAALLRSAAESLGAMLGPSAEAGRTQGIASMGSTSKAASGPQKQQQAPGAPPAGDMVAVGSGKATVNAAGESVMNVRMVITNMGEIIAHHATGEARLQEAL